MRRAHERGLNVTELLIVLAITAILLAAAVPNFAPVLERWRATMVADDLLSSFSLARAQAVATGQRVVLAPHAGDWSHGWRVFVDADNDGVFGVGDTEVQSYEGLPGGVTATASAGFMADGVPMLSFTAAGWPRARDGTTVTSGRVQVNAGSTARAVCVDARGRATVVTGGDCPN